MQQSVCFASSLFVFLHFSLQLGVFITRAPDFLGAEVVALVEAEL